VHTLPAILHNSPRDIAPAAERLARELLAGGARVALAYADCGSYGALGELCGRLGIAMLPGLHCYDVLAGPDRIRAELAAEPGTYLLTDFLVRSFERSVIVPLGLDRYPELWADYFGHYQRVVWLAQSPPTERAELAEQARAVAARFGLPLTVVQVGTSRLERALETLLGPLLAER
jgi:cytosine/adenosine deaminase-related metal-dependent hydrolase